MHACNIISTVIPIAAHPCTYHILNQMRGNANYACMVSENLFHSNRQYKLYKNIALIKVCVLFNLLDFSTIVVYKTELYVL